MPRTLLNVSKNGSATDENRKPTSKTTKLKKSITTANRKYNLYVKDQDRLVGGADVTEEKEPAVEHAAKTIVEEEHVLLEEKPSSTKKEDGKPTRSGGPCCTCLAQTPGTTGDKKVDEMIDYVHQNLQEAGKALATLSENFEHDSKLMFADILGRIQQWTGLVQNKLDICQHELEELRKELIARACEIENLRKQLSDCTEREKLLVATQTELEAQMAAQAVAAEETYDKVEEEESTRVSTHRASDAHERRGTVGGTIEIVCADAAIQSMMKDKDNLRREMELEAEIARLRKDNERIVKERAEYESAIQRALLRGVSSLNVEALRVLRCPPIPCCTPCAPCPASTAEPIVPCKRNGASAGTNKSCATQRGTNRRFSVCGQESDTMKRPCTSPCCATKRNRKPSSDNSMVFLLHQGDTSNICPSNNAPMPQVCGAPVMRKIEIPPCPRFSK